MGGQSIVMRLRFLVAATVLVSSSVVEAKSILFVGNSFTFGALSPVMNWQASSVTDLNNEGVGGVPALFKRFADESGLDFEVSLETAAGRSLQWHWANKRALIDRRWDDIILQEYSTLDPDRPGDPSNLRIAADKLARMARARNPRARIGLVATWSRPDQTFPPDRRWSGKTIQQMAIDIQRADEDARRASGKIRWVIPVGEAFNCAIARGIADSNPYDGVDPGKIDLWASDHYHASTAGYYLEALTIFARITGRDPRRLGPSESAAIELKLPSELAVRLQGVAFAVAARGACTPG